MLDRVSKWMFGGSLRGLRSCEGQRGTVEIFGYDLAGRLVHRHRGSNIVTNLGRDANAHLIADPTTFHLKAVAQMEFGSGTTPATVDDTTLASAVIITKPVSYSFPAARQVRFTAVILPGEGNGSGSQIYQEAGLLSGEGAMLARITGADFGVFTKTSSLTYTATWDQDF